MKPRTITDADREAAAVFAKAVVECGKSHEAIAAEIGVTPGMIHQWVKPLRPIAAMRAPAAARAVGIADPSTISVAFAQVTRGSKSQPVGLNQETLSDAFEVIRGAAELRGGVPEVSPRTIAIAYALLEDAGERVSPANMVKLVKAYLAREEKDDV